MKQPDAFPGFAKCVQMMSKGNAVGEDGFQFLLPHAAEYFPQLAQTLEQETDRGLRCWLLELMGYARNPQAMPIFIRYLYGEEEPLRSWAMWGLKRLDTKEARRVLWEADNSAFPSLEETARFHQQLAYVRKATLW